MTLTPWLALAYRDVSDNVSRLSASRQEALRRDQCYILWSQQRSTQSSLFAAPSGDSVPEASSTNTLMETE